jgi:hypothetical protein
MPFSPKIIQHQLFDQSLVSAERVEDEHVALSIFLNRAANMLSRPFVHVFSPTAHRVIESAMKSSFSSAQEQDPDSKTPMLNGIPYVVDQEHAGLLPMVHTIGISEDGGEVVSIQTSLVNLKFSHD